MPDFSKRSDQTEIMDDLNCSGEVVHQTLRELETINFLLGGNYVTINGISQLLENHNLMKPISVADLGCGGGDILKLIRHWALRQGYHLQLTGIDANRTIVAYARAHTSGHPIIHFETLDILSEEFQERQFDILVGTLFFHHFTSEQLQTFFRRIKEKTRIGIVINDIHRHWLAYYSIKWLTQLFSRSVMVKYDAPLSVLRSFKKKEWIEILENAGIKNYTIRWMWAFRWQIVIRL